MLTLVSAKFATVEELFKYKNQGFKLKKFPGYTYDQWGIKAHNRPWIEDVGRFKQGQKIIEVGGAYSTLPNYLAKKYKLEAWIGDDFGITEGNEIWKRWGDPKENAKKNPFTKYAYKEFGIFSKDYPNNYFNRVFSVSTLEHIHIEKRIKVFEDMNRCTKKGGMQIHAIDIVTRNLKECFINSVADKIPLFDSENILLGRDVRRGLVSEIKSWKRILVNSGIRIATKLPSIFELLDRSTLAESPDVIYRFIPPKNSVKAYKPTASLLLIIKDL
ncbi:class I SAM-dependent methyltransferase [bacterium]|jgi:hypothetical protein|nr:class I SAM-dependent methyltransferase [bacterium]